MNPAPEECKDSEHRFRMIRDNPLSGSTYVQCFYCGNFYSLVVLFGTITFTKLKLQVIQ